MLSDVCLLTICCSFFSIFGSSQLPETDSEQDLIHTATALSRGRCTAHKNIALGKDQVGSVVTTREIEINDDNFLQSRRNGRDVLAHASLLYSADAKMEETEPVHCQKKQGTYQPFVHRSTAD